MTPFQVLLRDLPHPDLQCRVQLLDEGALARAGVAAEQGDLALHATAELFNAPARHSGRANGIVPDVHIELRQTLHHRKFLLIVEIHFVKDQTDRDAEPLCRNQKTVDEAQRGTRLTQCHQQETGIHIGSNDVADFGKIGRFALDIVAARLYIDNGTRTVRLAFHRHMVAHHHGIGNLDAVDTELPAQTTGKDIFRRRSRR